MKELPSQDIDDWSLYSQEAAIDKMGLARSLITCPFRKSYPDIVVVQPGQDWDSDNSAGPLDCPTVGRVFAKR
jgi:hypothetical protein